MFAPQGQFPMLAECDAESCLAVVRTSIYVQCMTLGLLPLRHCVAGRVTERPNCYGIPDAMLTVSTA